MELVSQQFIDNQNENNNYLICEGCGAEMVEKGCKLIFQRGGYAKIFFLGLEILDTQKSKILKKKILVLICFER